MLVRDLSRRNFLLAAGVAATAVSVSSTAARSQDVKRVRLMHTQAGDPAMRKYFIDAIAQYNGENPGVEIIPEFIPWNEAYPKVQAGLQSGTPPDIVHGDPFAYGAMLAFGILEPVTGIIQELGWANDMYPNTRVVVEGNDFLVPTWAETLGLFYRKDWLEEKGISAPFKSWDEIIRAARALTEPEKGRWGISMGLKRAGKLGDDFFSVLTGLGGHIYNEDRTTAVNTPLFKETMEIFRQLCECSPPDSVEWEYAGVRTGYKTGKVGLHLYEPRTMTEILGEPYGGYGSGFPDLLDVTQWQMLPTRSAAEWPNKAFVRASLEGFCILKGSPLKDEAAKFITWFLKDRERYIRMLQTVPLMELPVLESVVEGDEYWDHVSYKRRPDIVPLLKGAMRAYGRSTIVNRKMDVYPSTVIAESSMALGSLAIDDALLAYISEKQPIDTVISELETKLAHFIRT
uniref:ABC transporter substrate-binding protein n=1 Tax=Aminobacter niigataensis TaxID=83265 RepID=UPI0028524E0E|nr:substrate-binding domain-containing protein [Aminobacter niigataensis]WMD00096.1 substrate-binding domain-containing protein [Aminobacter niigataensis]